MRGPSPISIVGEHFEPAAAAAHREVALHHFDVQVTFFSGSPVAKLPGNISVMIVEFQPSQPKRSK